MDHFWMFFVSWVLNIIVMSFAWIAKETVKDIRDQMEKMQHSLDEMSSIVQKCAVPEKEC